MPERRVEIHNDPRNPYLIIDGKVRFPVTQAYLRFVRARYGIENKGILNFSESLDEFIESMDLPEDLSELIEERK